MKIPFVDLNAQYLTIKRDIDDAIYKVIKEAAFVRSHFVDEFEIQWAKTLGVRHCISCGNGTDALYITMRGLGLRAGDEVLTTAHSWIATSETITQAGGRVVFCDTEDRTFNIDPVQIAAKITPRTVGIIPVHLFGQAANMEAIMAIAKRHNLWVIEDCAQAHLAGYEGHRVGTFGDAATFSFYPGKNLGAFGDAGCIVTNNDKLADWCAMFARHGGKGKHLIEGINSRMDGLQAAILSVKLPWLEAWTIARQKIAKCYDENLASVGNIQTPFVAAGRSHVYHLYVIRCESRDMLREHLAGKGVATLLNYPKALPFYPAYAYLKHSPEEFPNAYKNQSRILSLPIFAELSNDMVQYVAESIKDYYKSRGVSRAHPFEG